VRHDELGAQRGTREGSTATAGSRFLARQPIGGVHQGARGSERAAKPSVGRRYDPLSRWPGDTEEMQERGTSGPALLRFGMVDTGLQNPHFGPASLRPRAGEMCINGYDDETAT
jgi:hypothetical protein